MDNILVSVIMTNYNYDKFLTPAIEGVIGQRYQNWEFIIVDDGSTDNSREIIKHYASIEPRITFLFKENSGQCASFNAGFAVSKGDIIVLLDSDDYYYPNMLERKVEFHKTWGMVDSALSMDGVNPMFVGRKKLNWAEIYREWGYLYRHNNSSGLSFTRKTIEGCMPLIQAEGIYGALDTVLVGFALMNSEVFCDEEICGYYRQHRDHGTLHRKKFYEDLYGYKLIAREYVRRQFDARKLEMPDRELEYMKKLLLENEGVLRVVLYGTGVLSLTLRVAIDELGWEVVFYSDSNPDMWGSEFKGKKVVSPEEMLSRRGEYDRVVIASGQWGAILEKLTSIGLERKVDIIDIDV